MSEPPEEDHPQSNEPYDIHADEPPSVQKFTKPLPPLPAESGSRWSAEIRGSALGYFAAYSLVIPIILLAVLGYWLDRKLHHTIYWMSIVGLVFGSFVGVIALIRDTGKMK